MSKHISDSDAPSLASSRQLRPRAMLAAASFLFFPPEMPPAIAKLNTNSNWQIVCVTVNRPSALSWQAQDPQCDAPPLLLNTLLRSFWRDDASVPLCNIAAIYFFFFNTKDEQKTVAQNYCDNVIFRWKDSPRWVLKIGFAARLFFFFFIGKKRNVLMWWRPDPSAPHQNRLKTLTKWN